MIAPRSILLPALLLVLSFPGTARAQDDITARLREGFVYNDGVARVRVEIGRTSEDIVGASLLVPKGFRVEGPVAGARRTTMINGVSRTVTEIGFRIFPPATAMGEYPIGPVRLEKRSGAVIEIPVGPVKVGRRPEQGVKIEVEAEPSGGPVLMPFLVRYRVLYSGQVDEAEDAFGSARNPLGLTSLTIPLTRRRDVKIKPGRASPENAGGTVRLGDLPLAISRGHREVGGKLYRTLEFTLEVTPLATGSIDLSATVGMSLVTGKNRRRDFLGRIVEVPVAEERRARTGPVSYQVEDLPMKGRPEGFSGAVGHFTIEVDPQPREVNAFDPIEVTVTVRGQGLLERLALPRWSGIPEIARDFELDADLDPGEIVGDAKVFKVVFRARSSRVDRFPSLPFPYFDPRSRSYEVARSDPVPLQVREVKTIRADEAVGAPAPAIPADSGSREAIRPRLGVRANFDTLDTGAKALSAAPELFSTGFTLLLVLPPLLVVSFILMDRARSRPKDAPRGTPLSRALMELRLAEKAESPDRAAEAFAEYFRERALLSPGEITTSELERALLARSVSSEVVQEVTTAHQAFISARFAGGDPPAELETILREVDRCLD